jgi:hypothetical protein
MKRILAEMTTLERRWAAGIIGIVFLMLNYFFVWPHFHDWAVDTARMDKADAQIAIYQKEIRHKDEYRRKLNELQSDGLSVLPEDQAIDFVRFYNSRAVSNKVVVTSQGRMITSTNEFFLEQQVGITVQSDETNLVSFLYSLGAGNSMIRIRNMSLRPDPSHMQLVANISLVASYQKNTIARTNVSAVRALAETPRSAPTPATPVYHPPPAMAPRPMPALGERGPGFQEREHTNHHAGPFGRRTETNRTVLPNFKNQ